MGYSVNGISQPIMEKVMGLVPVMVRSNACHLQGLSPRELVKKGEHEQEFGGYFICGGHERLIRNTYAADYSEELSGCHEEAKYLSAVTNP